MGLGRLSRDRRQKLCGARVLSGGSLKNYKGRGTAEQWIKEGKNALNWTRLSSHRLEANQVRL